MSVPRATMRLQFHKGFTFDDAVSIVPYLAALNVSHLYASPIMAARAGSTHGYDVIDPTRVNPELGGEPGLRRLVAALRAAGLGIIVDIVPNHMAVSGGDNPWWLDVLQHGRQSRYAGFFDIDWEPDDPALHGKILVPVLQRPYGEALVKAEISLAFNGDCGRYEARYFHHVFPIAPRDWPAIGRLSLHAFNAASVNGRRRLHGLLERQHFRLAWWRAANDEINWRRFFDINELAGLRVEDDKVFQTTHATMFRLFAEGLIDGVRVDHVDGLSDPGAYCRRLRGRLDGLAHQRPPGSTADHAYVVVEKILGPGGQLPDGWECDGTSGYDFMDQVSRVLHDPAGAAPLGQLWASLSSRPTEFEIEEQRARREILDRSFSAQLAAAVTALHRICRTDLVTRDLAWSAIRRSLIEILAHMRVYRTYATPDRQSREDEDRLAFAVSGARRTCLPIDRDVVDQVAAWLSGRAGTAAPRELRAEALRRFQQLSAPLAAKAVEDTAFYRYGRLLSRVDVGFDPANFADGIAAFHQQSRLRAERFPYAMLATATHDHKRGEDVRARLAVLSEIPGEWSTKLDQWIEKTTPLLELVDGELAPSRGDVAMLFQTIVGAWPPELSAGDSDGCVAFAKRLVGWQQKALREAKLATDWTAPNESYEAAARQFLTGLFATDEWLAEIAVFAHGIAPAGAINGLAQTLLKLTAPGIPDIYQGTEFWDLSLVDPDNRRPVDFRSRMKAVGATAEIEHLACAWRGGWVKQAIIRLALEVRRTNPMLFSAGDCVPLTIEGHAADHVLAFARQHGNAVAVTVVCRLASRLLSANDTIVIPAPAWGETRLHLAGTIAARTFRDALAGVTLGSETGDIPVSEVLAKLPVALLVADRE